MIFLNYNSVCFSRMNFLQLKIWLKRGILPRRPKNLESIILNPPFDVRKLIWITNNFQNQYSYLRLVLHVERTHELQEIWVSFLASTWSQETRHFDLITLDIVCSVQFGECFLWWINVVQIPCMSRIHALHFVTTFLQVNNL